MIYFAVGSTFLSNFKLLFYVKVIIGEDKFIHFSGVAGGRACTVVIRGATQQILDEAERSLHDALCVLQQTLKEPKVIYGGGSGEMLMAKAVQDLSDKVRTCMILSMLLAIFHVICTDETLVLGGAGTPRPSLRGAKYHWHSPSSGNSETFWSMKTRTINSRHEIIDNTSQHIFCCLRY